MRLVKQRKSLRVDNLNGGRKLGSKRRRYSDLLPESIRCIVCGPSGRHSSIDSFYLCQTYSRVPKQLIRDNANLVVVFKQDNMNLRHVYDDHVNTDYTFDDFRRMCSVCWRDRYGFLVIDKDSNMNEGRYRKGFDTYITTNG